MSNDRRKSDRRKHPRFPIVEGMIEPITLRYTEPKKPGAKGLKSSASGKNQPAILTNLSAGGMSMITFVEPPHTKTLSMELTLPGLNHILIEAKIVRMHSKGETFNVGFQFTRIAKKVQKMISDMAADHMDCDTRISLNLPEVCVPNCQYHFICQKTHKAPHWPPKV